MEVYTIEIIQTTMMTISFSIVVLIIRLLNSKHAVIHAMRLVGNF